MNADVRSNLNKGVEVLRFSSICCCLFLSGCVTSSDSLLSYQREIANYNYNPKTRDFNARLLGEISVPTFESETLPSSDMLSAIQDKTGVVCSTVYADGFDPARPLTIPARQGSFPSFMDALCATNALYWMICDTNELFLLPTNRMNAGYVHVLPDNANWTNAVNCRFAHELVRRGESPVARNKAVRITEHETIPNVEFRDTPFKDAVVWLSGQSELPVVYLSKEGASDYPVSFDMTNAPLFTVLDEICRQSRHYWGFFNGKLALLSSEEFITNDAWLLPDSFLLTGKARYPAYRKEHLEDADNPVLLEKLHFLVNRPVIPQVSFTNTPVLDAISCLSKQVQQSYSARLGRSGDSSNESPITLSLTNTTFLSAIDAVCEQANWLWGFRGRIFMLFPESVLREKQKWRAIENEQAAPLQ